MELTIGGETFEVEVEGADDHPAVMLSCSLGTDLSLFDAQMPALLPHFRVVRYDPRGHGGSTTAGAPYSLAQLGHDALAILDTLAIETTHFVGISMGGAVGQWLLVNAPQRIGRAVLANTTARFGTPDVWNTRIATVLAEGTQALAPATMERWFSPAFRASAPQRVAAVDAMFRKTSAEGYAGACAALRDTDLREAIRTIDRPVLFVTGREDPVTSTADIAAIMGAIRGARHVELDCRHMSVVEQDAAFNAAVVAFLTASTQTRAPRKPPTPRRAATGRTTARSPLKQAPSSKVAAKRATPRARPAKATRRTARGTVAEPATAKPATANSAAPKPATAKSAGGRTPTKTTGANKAPVKKAPRKTAARRASAVRATPRKAATKVAAKKTIAKKVATKKAASKKPAGRRPTTARRASPKRPGRPGGRPKR